MKTISLYDEKELLLKLRSGDHLAFEKIYHLYKVRLTANALRLFKSTELAEELLQNLFLKIWEQRSAIDPSQSLNAYLYKIANNMAYDHFRKIGSDKKLYEKLVLATETSYNHIDKYILQKENQAEFNRAISLLPPQQQRVFTLCKLEEKSYKEVAQILNITTGTVNNHLTRANIFLRDYFLKKSSVAVSVLLAVIFQDIQ